MDQGTEQDWNNLCNSDSAVCFVASIENSSTSGVCCATDLLLRQANVVLHAQAALIVLGGAASVLATWTGDAPVLLWGI